MLILFLNYVNQKDYQGITKEKEKNYYPDHGNNFVFPQSGMKYPKIKILGTSPHPESVNVPYRIKQNEYKEIQYQKEARTTF